MGEEVGLLAARVLVVADKLVAEAVCLALMEKGLAASSRTSQALVRSDHTLHAQGPVAASEVGLLISDLDTEPRLDAARDVMRALPLRWAVLTGASRGPLWGSVLSAGAQIIMRNNASLNEVTQALHDLASGRQQPSGHERCVLVEQWDRVWSHRRETFARLASLSPREHEILRRLYRGERVSRIAASLGVADATVRSQVTALLRKLDVNSQIGAVAAYSALRTSHPLPAWNVVEDADGSDPSTEPAR